MKKSGSFLTWMPHHPKLERVSIETYVTGVTPPKKKQSIYPASTKQRTKVILHCNACQNNHLFLLLVITNLNTNKYNYFQPPTLHVNLNKLFTNYLISQSIFLCPIPYNNLCPLNIGKSLNPISSTNSSTMLMRDMPMKKPKEPPKLLNSCDLDVAFVSVVSS